MQKLNRTLCILLEIACVVMAAVLVLFMATSNSPLYRAAGSNSSIFLTVGKAITMGWTPYVDIVENKGPLLFFINALPQLFLERTLGIFLVELVLMVVAAILLLHATRMLACKRYCAVCVLVPAVYFAYLSRNLHGGNFGEEYNLFLTVVSIWAFVRAVSGQGRRGWVPPFLLGLCLAGVALIKISDIFGVGITVVFYLIWMAQKRRSFWKDAAAFAGGVALLTVPTMIYLMAHHAVGAMFEEYILSNFSHVGGENEAGFLGQRISLMRYLPYAVHTFKPLMAGAVAVVVVLLCRFIGRRVEPEQKQQPSGLMIAWIAALAVMCFAQAYGSSTGYGQHLMPIAASLAASTMVAVAALCRLIPEKAEGVRLAAGIASVALGAVLIVASPFTFYAAPRVGSEAYEAQLAYQQEFLEIIEDEKDSVFGIGMPRAWYLYNDVMPAYKCMNLVSYILAHVGENRAEDFEEALREDPIAWLVVKDSLESYRGILTDGTLDFIGENYYLYCTDESGSRELYRLF